MIKKTFFLTAIALLSGCTQVLIPQGDSITLQQPVTREIFVCENTEEYSAEECAFAMEQKEGFVRLTDKSVFPGKDDIPKPGSYPTRRYRDHQNIPRW